MFFCPPRDYEVIVLGDCSNGLSIAPTGKSDSRQYFTVTHCFHPLYKKRFKIFDHRQNWGEDRVFFIDAKGVRKSVPACWTSVLAADPFIFQSKGRSKFRVADLLELLSLMGSMPSKNKSTAQSRSVKKNR
jgi:hypothetical protein